MADIFADADASGLRSALLDGAFDVALDLLRFGTVEPTSACSAPPPLPTGLTWLHLTDAASSDSGANPWSPVLESLIADPRALRMVIDRPDASPAQIRVSLEGAASSVAQFRRLLAPQVVTAPSAAPSIATSGASVGVTFRLTPAMQPGHVPEGPPSLGSHPGSPTSMIARLIDLPVSGWQMAMTCRPVQTGAIDQLLADLEACELAVEPHRQVAEAINAVATRSVTNPEAERVRLWLQRLHRHAGTARSTGLWTVDTHIIILEPSAYSVVASSVRGALAHCGAPADAWVVDLVGCDSGVSTSPSSLVSSDELACLFAVPSASRPGLKVRPALPGGRSASGTGDGAVIGRWLGTDDEFTIAPRDLEGHAFVTGTTGSGKSTSVQRLLAGCWNDCHIPFLIIDPVKSDYESLAAHLDGGLEVVDVRDLALNVLQAWPGFDPETHLERVATVFKESFSMPPPIPYVITQLFDQVRDRVHYEPAPSLHDLRDRVHGFVTALGYPPEGEMTIRAAVLNRLNLLLAPARAERVAGRPVDGLETLLDRPTLLRLDGLGDEDDRAFLMSTLVLYVAEAARVRSAASRSRSMVRHLTVIEEAHRIVPQPPPVGGGGDDVAQVAGARMVANLLAEARGDGECMVIVDQSPGQVAREVIKNTNLKVLHRLPDPDDHFVAGASVGMDKDAAGALAWLEPGRAVIATRNRAEPVAVSIDPLPVRSQLAEARPASVSGWPCCAGSDPGSHHRSAPASGDAAWMLAPFVAGVGPATSPAVLREEVASGLARLASRRSGARIECLAWIGLRRIVFAEAEIGLIADRDAERRLGELHSAWRSHEPAARLEGLAEFSRPFEVCSSCTDPCAFRAPAALRSEAERQPSVRAAIAGRSPMAACRDWLQQEVSSLSPSLGADAARSLAACTLAHALVASNMKDSLAAVILAPGAAPTDLDR